MTVTLGSDWVVDEGSTPTEEPTPTPTPTTPVPTTTPTTPAPTTTPTPTPAVSPKVTVKGKVRAGKAFKIRVRDLAVNKVSITLAGKKLGTVKVKDGKVAVTRIVPKNLSGTSVLRVLNRKGEVLAKTTIKVLKRKAA